MRWDGHIKTTCSVSGCGRPNLAKGLCGGHYQRLKKTGSLSPEFPLTKSRLGSRNPKWKGGKTTDGHGRILLYRPNHPRANSWGYVYRYRIVAEKKLGRILTPQEVVHHIDGNPANDVPENLRVLSQSEHVKLHFPQMRNDKWRENLNSKRNEKGQFVC